MKENIATIREFLTHGKLWLVRGEYRIRIITVLNDQGVCEVYYEPHWGYFTITLTEKEIAELAGICFPTKEVIN